MSTDYNPKTGGMSRNSVEGITAVAQVPAPEPVSNLLFILSIITISLNSGLTILIAIFLKFKYKYYILVGLNLCALFTAYLLSGRNFNKSKFIPYFSLSKPVFSLLGFVVWFITTEL